MLTPGFTADCSPWGGVDCRRWDAITTSTTEGDGESDDGFVASFATAEGRTAPGQTKRAQTLGGQPGQKIADAMQPKPNAEGLAQRMTLAHVDCGAVALWLVRVAARRRAERLEPTNLPQLDTRNTSPSYPTISQQTHRHHHTPVPRNAIPSRRPFPSLPDIENSVLQPPQLHSPQFYTMSEYW